MVCPRRDVSSASRVSVSFNPCPAKCAKSGVSEIPPARREESTHSYLSVASGFPTRCPFDSSVGRFAPPRGLHCMIYHLLYGTPVHRQAPVVGRPRCPGPVIRVLLPRNLLLNCIRLIGFADLSRWTRAHKQNLWIRLGGSSKRRRAGCSVASYCAGDTYITSRIWPFLILDCSLLGRTDELKGLCSPDTMDCPRSLRPLTSSVGTIVQMPNGARQACKPSQHSRGGPSSLDCASGKF